MENEQNNRGSDELSIGINKLVQSLRSKTQTLEPLSNKCCIYRVSPRFRELNKKAYTPQVVSIGPFHHGKDELSVMEEHKRKYLVDFVSRCGISLEDYAEHIRKLEIPLRDSYAQMTQHTRDEFMEIMAVDAAFLLEFFLRSCLQNSESDRIFGRQQLVDDVRYDILMIENQIPFFLLVSLFELLNADHGPSLIQIVAQGLKAHIQWPWLNIDNMADREVKHLVDFLGICMQPSSTVKRRSFKSLTTPTISQLHRAGVKFEPSSSKCLYDLRFQNGVLKIPKLVLRDWDDIIFSNMQAYEKCHGSYNYMNDYTCIMDMLIDNEEDVDLLVQNGCIDNWLQDNHTAATMINDLGKSFFIRINNFGYADLVQDLNAYCKRPWNRWKATLEQKYFNNPWTIISVIAAVFLLLLTVIQTKMENEQNTGSDELSIGINKLVQSLRSKTQTLETLSDECCIYIVSPHSRELNKKAYSPKVVSIGPYHRGKYELRVVEEYKRQYLVNFVNRCGISLENYVENIRKLEIPLRNSYAQKHTRDEFMEIMALDAAFLLEYFLKHAFREWSSSDRICGRQRLNNDVRYDILMIENQLPFFLLESLFELLNKSNANNGLSLIEIVAKGLRETIGWQWLETDNIVSGEVKHLVDFLGICLQPSPGQGSSVTRQIRSLTAPNISELHRAGVKFKASTSKCLYELKFKNGILEIPKLFLRERDFHTTI